MPSIVRQNGSSNVFLYLLGEWYCFDMNSAPLGGGAMGVVYSGWNHRTGTPVAIKMVRQEYSDNQEIRRRARTEARMTFLHPNIVRNFGVCEHESLTGPIFIISEYVHGYTFDTYCRRMLSYMSPKGRAAQIAFLSASVLDALQYIHNVGVVHRDIKPSNIMVTVQGGVKVMDLGISKFEKDGGVELGFMGTSLYAAPEVIESKCVVDGRADIYAMGVTIYELITGYNPFNAPTQQQILRNQLNWELPADQLIPDELFYVLRKATSKNREDRYDTAAQFAKDLEQFYK